MHTGRLFPILQLTVAVIWGDKDFPAVVNESSWLLVRMTTGLSQPIVEGERLIITLWE